MTNDSHTPAPSAGGLKVTLDDIKAAYAATGARPVRHGFRIRNQGLGCCAVGALVLARNPDFNPGYRDDLPGGPYVGFVTQARNDFGLTDDEVEDLTRGFDGSNPPLGTPYHALGQAAWSAVSTPASPAVQA